MLIVSPSAFTAFSALALLVARHVPQCPVFMIEDQAKRAARLFFGRSNVWRSGDITLLTTVAGQAIYTLVPPTNAELNAVHSAWSGEDELEVEVPGEADDSRPGLTATTWRIGPRTENRLQLSPAPSVADVVVKGTVSFIPTNAGAGIPTYAFEEWGEAIAAGAAAQLVIEPNREWSFAGSHAGLQGMFDAAVRSASVASGPVRRRPIRTTPWG